MFDVFRYLACVIFLASMIFFLLVQFICDNSLYASDSSQSESIEKDSEIPMFACYYTWYETPYGPEKTWTQWKNYIGHGDPPGGLNPDAILHKEKLRDISSEFYPYVGVYSSLDRAVTRWHMQLAKNAGIDAFVIDTWGPGYPGEVPGLTHQVLFDVIRPEAEATGLKFFVFDETSEYSPHSVETTAKRMAEILKKVIDSPAYLKIDGKPALMIYQLWEGHLKPAELTQYIEIIESEIGPIYAMVTKLRDQPSVKNGIKQHRLYFPDHWLEHPDIDSIGGYATFCHARVEDTKDYNKLYPPLVESAKKHNKTTFLPVHPGFSNKKISNEPWEMSRDNGRTLKDYLQAAKIAETSFILLTSWNEWPESTVIEPSQSWDDPYQYLRIIAEFNGIDFQPIPLPKMQYPDSQLIN
ncbi:glycoside hydrolase family 99-like domain-containing protein [Planctomycetota bacterium]|nr:glycoside hydrolase family 99-like domain-containing protein [Planctomycetota bacterium]